MRLLLTSDLHYELRQYDWLIAQAADFDAVVIAGDHIDALSPVPSMVQIAAVSASLAALGKKGRLLVCSGNHDLNARSPDGEKTANWLDAVRTTAIGVDGDTVKLNGTLFTICPWWDGAHSRAAVERLLQAASREREERWVWVYHAPPEGLLSWTGKRHYGDPVLEQLVKRHSPTAVLCGHIHEAPFQTGGSWVDRIGATWLFNAGKQIGDVPARIEIDFMQQTARWISLAGIEERALQ
jgi:Icc-related predicted phosphoesterase